MNDLPHIKMTYPTCKIYKTDTRASMECWYELSKIMWGNISYMLFFERNHHIDIYASLKMRWNRSQQ